MTIKLPRIINDYVNASNAHDVKCILAAFRTMLLSVTKEKNFAAKK
jgi:hypothetical protein